jgi:hypothetical protein
MKERGKLGKKKIIHNPGKLIYQILFSISKYSFLIGINTNFVYFGCRDSVFPFHIEDVNYGIINWHYCAAPKIWIGFSARHYDLLVKYLK